MTFECFCNLSESDLDENNLKIRDYILSRLHDLNSEKTFEFVPSRHKKESCVILLNNKNFAPLSKKICDFELTGFIGVVTPSQTHGSCLAITKEMFAQFKSAILPHKYISNNLIQAHMKEIFDDKTEMSQMKILSSILCELSCPTRYSNTKFANTFRNYYYENLSMIRDQDYIASDEPNAANQKSFLKVLNTDKLLPEEELNNANYERIIPIINEATAIGRNNKLAQFHRLADAMETKVQNQCFQNFTTVRAEANNLLAEAPQDLMSSIKFYMTQTDDNLLAECERETG